MQRISIPNVRRKSSDQEIYLDVLLGLSCSVGCIMLMARCPQLQCVHLLWLGRARIASVDSCHQHASASTFLFPARPIRIYKQTHADSLLARANFGPTNGVHFTDVTCYDLQLSVATGVER